MSLPLADVDFATLAQKHAEPILRFFSFAHLNSPQLRAQSESFAELAVQIVETTPRSAERAAGLRKLLESLDCVRRNACT